MPTAMTQERPNRRHAHKPNGPDPATERCPWCGAKIGKVAFQRIRDQIAEQERARLAKVEQTLRQQFAREQQKASATAKAEIEKAKCDAAGQVEKARKDAGARETAIRKQAAEAAAKAKAEADKVKREAAARETAIRKHATEAAMAALNPKIAEAVNVEKARGYAEKLALETQLEDMKRRLQRRTANDLGEEGEATLYSALEEAFADEAGIRLSRVVKGVAGPDILVEIIEGDQVIDKIAIDCKNNKRWSNKFTSKLYNDAVREGASFAILATTVMPKAARQGARLHLKDNVLVADPALVVVLCQLLRRPISEIHRLRLTNKARDAKAERLLVYITSQPCLDLLDGIVKITSDLANLDLRETTAHQAVWKKRGELIRAIQSVFDEFAATISRIIEGEP